MFWKPVEPIYVFSMLDVITVVGCSDRRRARHHVYAVPLEDLPYPAGVLFQYKHYIVSDRCRARAHKRVAATRMAIRKDAPRLCLVPLGRIAHKAVGDHELEDGERIYCISCVRGRSDESTRGNVGSLSEPLVHVRPRKVIAHDSVLVGTTKVLFRFRLTVGATPGWVWLLVHTAWHTAWVWEEWGWVECTHCHGGR